MWLEVAFEGALRVDSIGRKLRVLTEKNMIKLTDILYMKVMENVSGKILQKRSGQLASSIHKNVEVDNDFYIGEVYVSPTTPKAEALEKGGKSAYFIRAVNKPWLEWQNEETGNWVRKRLVKHPPSKAFAYLRIALEETDELVPKGFRETVKAVLDGGDYGDYAL
jgi:hypothetical protein